MADDDSILWDVVEEHLDEAAFLAVLWRAARGSASYTLSALERGPQARMLAHVDGLVANGPAVIDTLLVPVLADAAADPTMAAIAALTMLQAGDARVWQSLAPASEPVAETAVTTGDGEAERLAALQALAERLDALGPEGSDVERQAFDLGAEGWRTSTLAGMPARLEAEADDERQVELQEIEVLLAGNAPPTADAAVEDADADAEEEQPSDLDRLRAQLEASDDDDDRRELQTLIDELEHPEPAEPDAQASIAAPPVAAPPVAAPPGEPVDPRIEGLGLALALATHPQLDDQLRLWVARGDDVQRLLALRACADRGADPGAALERALGHADPQVRAAALRAAAFADRGKWQVVVERSLQHADRDVRAAALDTAMMWGSHRAWEVALASYKQPGDSTARVWVALRGTDAHVQALVGLLADETLRHDVLWALGFTGSIRAVEAALGLLADDDERTARLAGEVITSILGVAPDEPELWELMPRDSDEPLAADVPAEDLDVDLVPTPDDDLPLPKPAALRAHVARMQADFVPGKRYLLGRPVDRGPIAWALAVTSCRRVDVLAREVAARTQGVGRWPGHTRATASLRAAAALGQLER